MGRKKPELQSDVEDEAALVARLEGEIAAEAKRRRATTREYRIFLGFPEELVKEYFDELGKRIGDVDASDMAGVLRAALVRSIAIEGRPVSEIAKASGVHATVIYRFANSQRGIGLETASRIAKAVGLVLVSQEKVATEPMGTTLADKAKRVAAGSTSEGGQA